MESNATISKIDEKGNPSSFQKRQTAYKVRIKDVLDNIYVKEGGFLPNYLKIGNYNVSRVNLIGTIVFKNDEQGFTSFLLDDGSGKINLRSFDAVTFPDIQIGSLVNIIGRPREYNNEKFIVPEIIHKVENQVWIKVREFELRKLLDNGLKTMSEVNMPIIERVPNEKKGEKIDVEEIEDVDNSEKLNHVEQILKIIKDLDKGEGIEIEEIVKHTKDKDTEKMIHSLLLQGDIFETKPGRIRILD